MGNLMHKYCIECLEKNAPDPTHRTGDVDCVKCSNVNPVVNLPNLYFCSVCTKIVPKEEIVSSECPWCRVPMHKHKNCGGKATQK